MPDKVLLYKALISCPSDASKYIPLVRKAIDCFNSNACNIYRVWVSPIFFEKDGYPEYGVDVQSIINEQFADDTDFAICIFHHRFGTPTMNSESGTYEEIERKIQANKQIFVYFIIDKVDPWQLDIDQFNKLKAFVEKHKSRCEYKMIPESELGMNVISCLFGYFKRRIRKNNADEGEIYKNLMITKSEGDF